MKPRSDVQVPARARRSSCEREDLGVLISNASTFPKGLPLDLCVGKMGTNSPTARPSALPRTSANSSSVVFQSPFGFLEY